MSAAAIDFLGPGAECRVHAYVGMAFLFKQVLTANRGV